MALLAISGTASAQQVRSAPDSRTVVFVCEHGTVKSVVALVYFEQFARQAKLPMRAVSRGTAPDSALPLFMRERLRQDGFDLGAFTPTRFGSRDLSAALIVSFDQPGVAGLVGGRAPTLAWDRLPSVSANYPVARDSIRQRVRALVDSLARTRPD